MFSDNNHDVWALVSAGGKGERLWPLSRTNHPKQLLKVGKKTILEDSIERLFQHVDKKKIVVIATEEQRDAVKKITDQLGVTLIVEPNGRNTAPACLFGIDYIEEKNNQALILFTPADHVINSANEYAQSIKAAINEAYDYHAITLLGITPRSAHTGYGYIEYDQKNCSSHGGYSLLKFHEKPSQAIAQEYIKASTMLWNSGIVCAPLSVLKNSFKTLAPELVDEFEAFKKGLKLYVEIASISLDYAVLEKVKNVRIIPAAWEWYDVGDLQSFITLQHQKQNYTQAAVSINAHNNVIHVPKKLVAVIGINNVCIVETDDVLCIAQLEQAADVKQVVCHLKSKNLAEYT